MEALDKALTLINGATHFLVCTGAGMSADSGIPVYHSEDGQWGSAYNAVYAKYELTNEQVQQFGKRGVFESKALMFWRYFFSQFKKFEKTPVHDGYTALHQIIGESYYIVTSNIDGAHLKAGASPERVIECHGAVLKKEPNTSFYGVPVQCVLGSQCSSQVWTHYFPLYLFDSQDLQEHHLPYCKVCERVARPNYLSCEDDYCIVKPFTFSPIRENMQKWLQQTEKLVILEIGVGNVIENVQKRAHSTLRKYSNSSLIRINPVAKFTGIDEKIVDLQMGAEQALTLLAKQRPDLPDNPEKGASGL
uniref:Sir2 family protein n=1 Tax=Marseillevirus LCMAC202 TaxID=2506606 RepID=A0A481YZC8_9VIRU|nr:MAG: Sir2 family protein [Marseillevirus LCMAC202]